jgi:hypothetical protein
MLIRLNFLWVIKSFAYLTLGVKQIPRFYSVIAYRKIYQFF